jgi:hypothetical protein
LPESSSCRLILGNYQQRRQGEQDEGPNQRVLQDSFCLHGNPFLFVDATSFILSLPYNVLYNKLDGQQKQIFKLDGFNGEMDWQMHCKGHSINEVGGHRVNQVSFLKFHSKFPIASIMSIW